MYLEFLSRKLGNKLRSGVWSPEGIAQVHLQ